MDYRILLGPQVVMLSLTAVTSCLSVNGLARKLNCV
jgi:hypothetical protein